VIVLKKKDVERLAKGFGLDYATAEKRFTRPAENYKRVMRRKPDEHFGKICQFFDTEARRCTIYHFRPGVCREFPGEGRCGYYDFLKFERAGQEDPDYISTTDHEEDA
jgi:hypothetical protein